MSHDNIKSNPKKEDDVREALGVEKRFKVNISIPITGSLNMRQIVVDAVNPDEAKTKAKELAIFGEADANGDEPEEAETDYDYVDPEQWNVEVTAED